MSQLILISHLLITHDYMILFQVLSTLERIEVNIQLNAAGRVVAESSPSLPDGLELSAGQPSSVPQPSMIPKPVVPDSDGSHNEGPSLLQTIQDNPNMSANDPNLERFDPIKKPQPAYVTHHSIGSQFMTSVESSDSGTSAKVYRSMDSQPSIHTLHSVQDEVSVQSASSKDSESSASTDIYSAVPYERPFESDPGLFNVKQQYPMDSQMKALSMQDPPRPVPHSGFTSFYNAEPYKLQQKYDAERLASHGYENLSMTTTPGQSMNWESPSTISSSQPSSITTEQSSMTSIGSTEELSNNRNEEYERSLTLNSAQRVPAAPEGSLPAGPLYGSAQPGSGQYVNVADQCHAPSLQMEEIQVDGLTPKSPGAQVETIEPNVSPGGNNHLEAVQNDQSHSNRCIEPVPEDDTVSIDERQEITKKKKKKMPSLDQLITGETEELAAKTSTSELMPAFLYNELAQANLHGHPNEK